MAVVCVCVYSLCVRMAVACLCVLCVCVFACAECERHFQRAIAVGDAGAEAQILQAENRRLHFLATVFGRMHDQLRAKLMHSVYRILVDHIIVFY